MFKAVRYLTPIVLGSLFLAWNLGADQPPKTGTVAGSVKTHDGKAAVGTVVQLQRGETPGKPPSDGDAPPGTVPKATFETKVDKDGRFSFAKVPIGPYRVVAGDQRAMAWKELTVKA